MPPADPNELKDRVQERAVQNEPIIDPVVLDMLSEMDLPLRGPLREGIVTRLRESVRDRRRLDNMSSRLADAAVQPVTNAIEGEARDRTRNRVRKTLEENFNNGGRRDDS